MLGWDYEYVLCYGVDHYTCIMGVCEGEGAGERGEVTACAIT